MKHATLAAAICAVMHQVKNVEKGGRNTFHGYAYASEADLLFALQPLCAEHGVAILPISHEAKIEQGPPTGKGKPQLLTTIVVRYKIVHADSGESYELSSVGSGIDGEDKGAYKAMTGAQKYLLRQLFLIPTGDDPDANNEQPPQQEEPAPPKKWSAQERNDFRRDMDDLGVTPHMFEQMRAARNWEDACDMTPERRAKLVAFLKTPNGQALIDSYRPQQAAGDMP